MHIEAVDARKRSSCSHQDISADGGLASDALRIEQRSGLIDGARGLSVLLVIVGHVIAFRAVLPSTVPLRDFQLSYDYVVTLAARLLFPVGGIGVHLFFLISGFLITTLLLKEESARGKISLAAFYVRRAFRILPAFVALVLVLVLLRANGLVQIPNEAFFRSIVFLCNVSEFRCSWWLAHTWSLSVEEQFYLCWPLIFLIFRPARVQFLITVSVLFSAGSVLVEQLNSFAHISVGALFAASSSFREALLRISSSYVIALAAAALLLAAVLPGPFKLAVGVLSPVLTAIVLFGTLSGRGFLVVLFDNPALQRIGLMSYSLYLWQQLGTAPAVWGGSFTGATTFYEFFGKWSWLFFVPAAASYFLLEGPCIRMGRILSGRILKKAAIG